MNRGLSFRGSLLSAHSRCSMSDGQKKECFTASAGASEQDLLQQLIRHQVSESLFTHLTISHKGRQARQAQSHGQVRVAWVLQPGVQLSPPSL